MVCTSLLESSLCMYVDVIVGFNQTEFTVSEEVGEIQLCLVMILPPPGEMFTRSFPAGAETRDGTATRTFFGGLLKHTHT